MILPVAKSFWIDARMLFSSGIGTVIQNVIKRLPSTRWNYTILVENDRAAKWVQENRPEARTVLVSSAIYSISEQLTLPRLALGANLFWAPHYNIPLFFPGRIIATVHDVLHVAHPEFFPGLAKQIYAKGLLRGVKMRCHRVVCVSEFTAQEMVRFTGIPRSRITVVPNGVDESWFNSAPFKASSPPYFVYLGNVKPHKNLVRLLEAFAGIMDRVPHSLLLVGKREGFLTGDSRVESVAAQLGDRVRFTGWVDDNQLRQYIGGATALVFPSLYEGFGLPALEAMAAGCPVLTSRAASLPEVCGDAALYFDPFSVQEIRQMMLRASSWSPEERNDLVQLGRERARQYSWDKTVELLLNVFEEAI